MSAAQSTAIEFTLGSRRLAAIPRQLSTWSFDLEGILHSDPACAAPPQPGRDGLRVLSAPLTAVSALSAHFPQHLMGGQQNYRRHYIAMAGQSYDDYFARFSGKTRSTLRRKAKRLADKAGGAYEVSEYRSSAELERFFASALPLSQLTYQTRLLDAGLPDSPEARQEMYNAAANDRLRCFLLQIRGTPIAYLALPITGTTLVYAHLGYHPDWARFSPGTVLQMAALERLFAEERYDYFDFTEGDGPHKAMFGTNSVECSSFVLLRPTLTNRALLFARAAFDACVSSAKAIADQTGSLGRLRAALRA